MSTSSTPKATSRVRLIAVNIVVLGVILVVVEGVASYVLLVRDVVGTHSIAESFPERRHTRYDPELGWVNEPSVHIPDMYEPGVYLRTNAQGFRNNHDVGAAVPTGRHRVICSGDSFTLGYGVDNDHTWCHLLTLLDPRLDTVNMGQGGYGVDQAYLWYKRDGDRLEHQVHLLAFITPDFERMQSDTFQGYGKPVIGIENGALVVRNVPVPKGAYVLPWLASQTQSLSRLRSVEFVSRAARTIGLAPDDIGQLSKEETDEKTREVLRLIFVELKRLNEERSSTLVLVYLPVRYELEGQEPREWMQFIERESHTLGIPFINVFSVFRSLPADEIDGKFAFEDDHLSIQGNELVARVIYEELQKHPAMAPGRSE